MKGPARVEFMPIQHGDVIDLNDGHLGHTIVHQIGFKPGPARSRSGWLVLLVHEGELPYLSATGHRATLKIPRSVRPHKLRGSRETAKRTGP